MVEGDLDEDVMLILDGEEPRSENWKILAKKQLIQATRRRNG